MVGTLPFGKPQKSNYGLGFEGMQYAISEFPKLSFKTRLGAKPSCSVQRFTITFIWGLASGLIKSESARKECCY